MNIKHLEYFITLSKIKNYSKASEQLGVTQPTLTQAVQKLEATLGTQLFDRSFSGFVLTEAGKVLLEAAKQIDDIWKQTVIRIGEQNKGFSGTVSIGISQFRAYYTVPQLLDKINTEHKGVLLRVFELKTEEMFEALDSGELDFIITPCDKKTAAKYTAIPAFEEEVLLAIPKSMLSDSYLSDSDTKIQAADISVLEGVGIITLGSEQILYKYYFSLCEKYGIEMKTVAECTSIETSLSLANSGFGGAFVHSSGVKYYMDRFPNLVYFSLTPSLKKRTVYVLFRKNAYLSVTAKDVMALLLNEAN